MRAVFKAVNGAIGAVLGASWLLCLYGLTIWISAGSLSAIQLRADLNASLIDGQPELSFSDVKRAQSSYDRQFQLIDEKRGAAYDELQRLYDRGINADQIYLQVDRNVQNIAGRLAIEWTSIDPNDIAANEEIRLATEECQVTQSGGGSAASVCDLIAGHDDLVAEAHRAYDEAWQAASGAAMFDASSVSDNVRQKIAAIDEEEATLRNNAPLSRHFDTYSFMSGIPVYASLLHMPQHVLVLILTVAMGMLGSVVTMTWLFIRQDSGLSARRFVILPFIGSMSAFIVLIFVSAGQLTLTAGDAQDSLNPYVLSFVGIISGLMSERAYTRLSDVGASFFTVDDGQPRWGFRLKEALESVGVSIPELAKHLGTTEEEAGRIASESTTATLTQQRLIAACVRRNVRELFTDVPPDGPAADTLGAPVIMPDLTGLDPAVLKKVLEDIGLRQGERAEAPSGEVAAGFVMAQSPSPGSRVPRKTRVDYTVALAPLDIGAVAEESDTPDGST